MACDTVLLLSGIPTSVQERYNVGKAERVIFCQTDNPFGHRDAVRFADGKEVLLQDLGEGVEAHHAFSGELLAEGDGGSAGRLELAAV